MICYDFGKQKNEEGVITELTPYALRELVKAIYVEAPDKSGGKRKQKIPISYDLIGFIPVDVLTYFYKKERVAHRNPLVLFYSHFGASARDWISVMASRASFLSSAKPRNSTASR